MIVVQKYKFWHRTKRLWVYQRLLSLSLLWNYTKYLVVQLGYKQQRSESSWGRPATFRNLLQYWDWVVWFEGLRMRGFLGWAWLTGRSVWALVNVLVETTVTRVKTDTVPVIYMHTVYSRAPVYGGCWVTCTEIFGRFPEFLDPLSLVVGRNGVKSIKSSATF